MINIDKLENVFGISKVVDAEGLGNIIAIYDPNGTAKAPFLTSFITQQ